MAETTTFSFGGPQPLTVVCAPSLPWAPLTGAPGGASDATGLLTWPGARALCRLLAFCPELRGAVCVELGCGSGVVGAAAASLCGAAFVLATDGAPAALPLAAATLAANGVTACGVALLPWGAAHVAPLRERCLRGRRCRIVLASECVYPSSATASIEALLATAGALLDARDPAAALLMSYVPRAPETTERLCAAAWRGGWAWAALGGGGAAAREGEAGAVVLRLVARPPGGAGGWEGAGAAMMEAAFPGARASARAVREYAEEAEAERAAWGPPLEQG